MRFFCIIALIFINLNNLYSKGYELEWTGDMKFTKSIIYQDNSIFKIVHPSGYWQDNEGNFGKFSCVGWVKNIKDKENLEVNCEA